ncbi:hypothetical protein [Winogradskya humida]|uniref:hypothetical protein n=1 Tax=Winogradskya humida TaxID=113566 RepID=UPI001942F20F|nr:hypothetical protein [Actinoplanes humidus]
MTVLIYLETNGVRRHIGTAEALESNYSYTSADIDTFAYQLAVRKFWSERYGNFDFFAQVYGISWCEGACKPESDTGLQPGWFRNGVDNESEAYWGLDRDPAGRHRLQQPPLGIPDAVPRHPAVRSARGRTAADPVRQRVHR